MHQNQLQFQIQWVDYDRPTYQLFENVKNATETLNHYFHRHSITVSHDIWANYDSDNNDSLYQNTWGFTEASL